MGGVISLQHLLVDPPAALEGPGVAGVAQLLLRTEVVPDQPARHAGCPGDVTDRGSLDATFGEEPQRRIPDAGAGRQVFRRRLVQSDSTYSRERYTAQLSSRLYSRIAPDPPRRRSPRGAGAIS